MFASSNVGVAGDVLRVLRCRGLGPRLCDSLRLLPRARCRQCLEILRSVAGAKSRAIHLHILMIAVCGDCLGALLAMVSNLASSGMCEVPGGSCGHILVSLVRRLSPARCRQCLGTLRPVTGAKSQVLHLGLVMTVRLHCCFHEISQCLEVALSLSK